MCIYIYSINRTIPVRVIGNIYIAPTSRMNYYKNQLRFISYFVWKWIGRDWRLAVWMRLRGSSSMQQYVSICNEAWGPVERVIHQVQNKWMTKQRGRVEASSSTCMTLTQEWCRARGRKHERWELFTEGNTITSLYTWLLYGVIMNDCTRVCTYVHSIDR